MANNKLACNSTASEYVSIATGLQAYSLKQRLDVALLPTVPTRQEKERLDEIYEDEPLFAQDKEAWLAKRLQRAFTKS